MNTLIPIICCILCYAFGIVTCIFAGRITNIRYLNSSVYYPTSSGIEPVKFTIIKIEKALDTKYNSIAKYTVNVHFFSKENCKNWKYAEFCFYAEVDKYKIGDILTFDKMN